MKHWRAALLLLATLTLAMPMAARADTLVTLLVDEAYPPFTYREAEGSAAGIYIAVLRAAEPHLQGYRLRFRPMPWRRAMIEIEAGRALAVVPPYFRPEERPWIKPYSVPILQERVVVFCHRDVFAEAPRPSWPDDYRGLRFGNNPGYLSADATFWREVARGAIQIEDAPGNRANLQKLMHRRIDCYFNERLSILAELAQMRRDGLFGDTESGAIAEGPTISVENSYVGFSDRSGDRFPYKEDFVRQLNAALEQLRRTGEIERIAQRYTQ
ncbi:substrate-binding periplasmic protein [Pseudomonas benzenivorans]|uniref:Transporter substrate-binding domain-containing protein n=1 Tax=Pseudomonas benzenivorans TaxID=556533 RepID=A0ABY5HB68_9PSED|nr:transporter substrate-binding domain-containing protein [Pseudomonas benzenivorans]UTW09071.1 transporter substrate-binding domain-containing protein [Pseudomonas benzenivorans]